MFKPRNTLVTVEVIESKEKQIGKIVVPTNGDMYAEAAVVEVGPGTQLAGGARSETFDLHPGQRVLVKHKEVRQAGSGYIKNDAGVVYHDNGRKLLVVDQSSILGIIHDGSMSAIVPFVKHPSFVKEQLKERDQ